ncbi:hypothetical protein [Alkalicoccobacillus porphyridii]|uniref:Uncharacterized protein n=1 Tax=Alkalicoccobacillus porphyridii TaxID=2597270 RepID=A0A553ZXS5_9BACI|nr:hypothetical protein [Alkalicoccobacillus porphyridii]TSB46156.1 hypothetical protein FN960_12390 [Alkalicoccobacillus porphyridii]
MKNVDPLFKQFWNAQTRVNTHVMKTEGFREDEGEEWAAFRQAIQQAAQERLHTEKTEDA